MPQKTIAKTVVFWGQSHAIIDSFGANYNDYLLAGVEYVTGEVPSNGKCWLKRYVTGAKGRVIEGCNCSEA